MKLAKEQLMENNKWDWCISSICLCTLFAKPGLASPYLGWTASQCIFFVYAIGYPNEWEALDDRTLRQTDHNSTPRLRGCDL